MRHTSQCSVRAQHDWIGDWIGLAPQQQQPADIHGCSAMWVERRTHSKPSSRLHVERQNFHGEQSSRCVARDARVEDDGSPDGPPSVHHPSRWRAYWFPDQESSLSLYTKPYCLNPSLPTSCSDPLDKGNAQPKGPEQGSDPPSPHGPTTAPHLGFQHDSTVRYCVVHRCNPSDSDA